MLQQIKHAQETVSEGLLKAPSYLKDKALQGVKDGYHTLRGSGSVLTELKNIKDNAIKLPVNMAVNAYESIVKLGTFQPVEATKKLFKGTIDMIKDATTIMVSPVSLAVAGTEQTFKGAWEVVKLPIKAPIKAFQVVKKGTMGVLSLLDSPKPKTASSSSVAASPAALQPSTSTPTASSEPDKLDMAA